MVASEVKSLSRETERSTDLIGDLISRIQAAARDADAAVEKVGETIAAVDGIAGSIALAMADQSRPRRKSPSTWKKPPVPPGRSRAMSMP